MIARFPSRPRRNVAHITQESTTPARVHRIELKRKTVRIVEVDSVYGFALPKNRLRGSLHLGETSQDSVHIEVFYSPAEMREAVWRLSNALRVSLRQGNIGRPVSDSENRLPSAVVLKSVNRHSEDAPVPPDGAPNVVASETYMV